MQWLTVCFCGIPYIYIHYTYIYIYICIYIYYMYPIYIYIYIYIYVYLYMYGGLEELCIRAVGQGFATSSRQKAPKRPKGKRKTTAIQAGKTKTPRELRQLRKHAAKAFCHGGFVMKCHDFFFHFLLGLGNDPNLGYDGYDPQNILQPTKRFSNSLP